MTEHQPAPLTFDPNKLAVWSLILAVGLALLVVGAGFLIPLAVAVLVWGLLNALRDFFHRLAPGGREMPYWLATTLAIATILAANYLFYRLLVSQTDALVAAAPVYQSNFAELTERLARMLRIEQMPSATLLVEQLDLGALLSWVGGSVGAVLTDVILVAIYVGFLLAEQEKIPEKLAHLQSDEAKARQLQRLATDISRSVQRYISMKTAVSALTGLLSYVVLRLVGVDFAAIWALLIFLLNFIPNIGSVVGVALPALLTLVQFETFTPFIIVMLGLGATQFVIGSIVEPAYMGRSLNLSSFMIILALTFWGSVWGIVGMFLSVPLMVVTGIVCSQFAGLRWIAVLLSVDGRLMTTEK